jgi:pyruvate carboxylase
VEIGKVSKDGVRRVTFEVNGNTREIIIMDEKYKHRKPLDTTLWADPENKKEIGASIPGTVSQILVQAGDSVKSGQSLMIIEAMKMETHITASQNGTIVSILVKEGQQVKTGQLLLRIE